MTDIYFKYNNPPQGFLQDEKIHLLPNPQQDIQEFLVWFLKDYQSDERIGYLKDLYKLQNKDFKTKVEEETFSEKYKLNPEFQIEIEITTLEGSLRLEACENFYKLLMENSVQIVDQEPENKEEDH